MAFLSGASRPSRTTDLNAILEGLGDSEIAHAEIGSQSSGSHASGCAFCPSNATVGAGTLGLLLALVRRRRNRR